MKVEINPQVIKSRLSSGEDVLISGFGKFCVKRCTPPAGGDLSESNLPFFGCGCEKIQKYSCLK
jgi:hypothetical protein